MSHSLTSWNFWHREGGNDGVGSLNYIHLLKFIYKWNGDDIIEVGIKPSVSLGILMIAVHLVLKRVSAQEYQSSSTRMFSFQRRCWGSIKSEGTEYSMVRTSSGDSPELMPCHLLSGSLSSAWTQISASQDITILSPTSHPIQIFHHRRTWIKSWDILWSHREVLLKIWKLKNKQNTVTYVASSWWRSHYTDLDTIVDCSWRIIYEVVYGWISQHDI